MNVFVSSGRCNRQFFFVTSLLCKLIQNVSEKLLGIDTSKETTTGLIIYFMVSFVAIYIFAMVGAKRCHDIGKPGWYMLIPFYFIWAYFAPGEPNDNKYGSKQ